MINPPDPEPVTTSGPVRDWVAIVVAVGLSTSVNVITLAAVWNAVENGQGLSENATQVLTTAMGGMVGLLGGYLGFKAGAESQLRRPPDTTPSS